MVLYQLSPVHKRNRHTFQLIMHKPFSLIRKVPAVRSWQIVPILILLPDLAFAADDQTSGIPLWVYPVGLLMVAVVLRAFQGQEGTAKKRKPDRSKARRPASAQQKSTAAQQPMPKPVVPTTTPIVSSNSTAMHALTEAHVMPEVKVKDALEDAQEYIDRERLTEAVIILQEALQQTPQRMDLQLKLLEVYALQQNMDAFELQYQTITNYGQDNAIHLANSLRTQFSAGQISPAFTDNTATNHGQMTPPVLTTPVTDAILPPDHSMAELEAEFGFGDQSKSSNLQHDMEATAEPSAKDTSNHVIDFDLGEFKIQPLKIADRKALQPEEHTVDSAEHLLDFSTNSTSISPPQHIEPTEITSQVVTFSNLEVPTASTRSDAAAGDFLLSDFPFIATLDIQNTNLELAESYLKLGEKREACELLKEVMFHGSQQQQQQAQQLINKLAS